VGDRLGSEWCVGPGDTRTGAPEPGRGGRGPRRTERRCPPSGVCRGAFGGRPSGGGERGRTAAVPSHPVRPDSVPREGGSWSGHRRMCAGRCDCRAPAVSVSAPPRRAGGGWDPGIRALRRFVRRLPVEQTSTGRRLLLEQAPAARRPGAQGGAVVPGEGSTGPVRTGACRRAVSPAPRALVDGSAPSVVRAGPTVLAAAPQPPVSGGRSVMMIRKNRAQSGGWGKARRSSLVQFAPWDLCAIRSGRFPPPSTGDGGPYCCPWSPCWRC
jgi:hypothetical protein